jgi:hypothetical protein
MLSKTALTVVAGVPLALAQPQYSVITGTPVEGNQVLDGFVSYSIEFSSFPDFAGKS